MFSYNVDEEVQLTLQAPYQAAEQYQLAERSRVFLSPWMNWMSWVQSEEDMQHALAYPLRAMANGETWGWTICYRGETAGRILLSKDIENEAGELGYWLGEDFTGHGIMTRAARAVLDWGFAELGLHRIEIHIEADNAPSRAVAERLGAALECTLREETKRENAFADLCVYGILAHEWFSSDVPVFAQQVSHDVSLRLQQLHDAEAMFSLLLRNAAHFSRSLTRVMPGHTLDKEREHTRAMLREYAEGRAIFMGIWQGEQIIGSMTVHIHKQNRHARLDYALAEATSAQDVMPSIFRAVMQHCFAVLHLNRCWLRFPAADSVTVQIAEELGMQREALLREWVAVQGQRVDMVVYSRLKAAGQRDTQGVSGC